MQVCIHSQVNLFVNDVGTTNCYLRMKLLTFVSCSLSVMQLFWKFYQSNTISNSQIHKHGKICIIFLIYKSYHVQITEPYKN